MSDLSPLFDVDAPAGTYHGEWGNYLEHGQAISDSVGGGHWWCVNAGVMRLDPPVCSRARRQHVDVMIEEVQRIDFPTNLPEQYFLAERMAGWRHIDPSWNYEVGPQYADPGFTWPRSSAIKTATTFRGSLWHMQRVEAVHVFHFSGTLLHPWWYVDMTPEKAYKEVAAQWYYRDPKRMLATAVREWVSALNEAPRDLLLRWLLGEATFGSTGALEKHIIFGIFGVLVMSSALTTSNACLGTGSCKEERARHAAALAEARKLRDILEQLRPAVAGTNGGAPDPAALADPRAAEDSFPGARPSTGASDVFAARSDKEALPPSVAGASAAAFALRGSGVGAGESAQPQTATNDRRGADLTI